MQFEIVPLDKNAENIIDFITDHYSGQFEDISHVINIPLTKELFGRIKNGSGKEELLKISGEYYSLNSNQLKSKLEFMKNRWQKYEIKIISNGAGWAFSCRQATCG